MTEAIFRLVGVVVGSFIAWVKDAWLEYRTQHRSARYLAIRTIITLDRYLDQVVDVACDSGMYVCEAHGQEERRSVIKTPDPIELPKDVDWKSIEHPLMYQLLSLPNEAWEAEKAIQNVVEFEAGPPDYEEYFEERQLRYALLGLKAHELASQLRRKYKIPARKFEGWTP